MVYTIEREAQVTLDVVNEYFLDHFTSPRRTEQTKLRDAYLGKYEILNTEKPTHKPNNKLVNNFAKKVTDTFCGYFDGKPMTVSSQNESVQDAVDAFNDLNDTDYQNYELIRKATIYGNCYELVYQDEEGNTKNAVLDPLDTFVVYDDTVEHKPVFAVTYRIDEEGTLKGEVYTAETIYSIVGEQSSITSMSEVSRNEYYDVPVIEYCFNDDRQGIFENSLSLIDAYNKVESEETNEVQYFNNAYLVITGASPYDFSDDVEEGLQKLSESISGNQLLLLNGGDEWKNSHADAKFLSRPSSSEMAENLLNRLREDIYGFCSVPDITDESFGTSSGIAMQYKMQPMRNLAKAVQRNISKSLRMRYKLVFSFAKNISPTLANEWSSLEFKFYENLPTNALEIAQALATFKGLVSDETALTMAGIDNPMEELERMEKEQSDTLFDIQKVATDE